MATASNTALAAGKQEQAKLALDTTSPTQAEAA